MTTKDISYLTFGSFATDEALTHMTARFVKLGKFFMSNKFLLSTPQTRLRSQLIKRCGYLLLWSGKYGRLVSVLIVRISSKPSLTFFCLTEQLYVGFTCGNFGPCGAQIWTVREGINNGGRQKQTRSLGPSALFTGVNNYLSTEL